MTVLESLAGDVIIMSVKSPSTRTKQNELTASQQQVGLNHTPKLCDLNEYSLFTFGLTDDESMLSRASSLVSNSIL